MESSGYSYSTLLKGRTIRYMALKPGSNQDPLVCSLETSQLDEIPAYDAVSYTWGHPSHTSSVTLGTHQVGITANLDKVLRRVRLPDRERFIWADQICIDQGNRAERSHQVGLMADIYRHADSVLIWLGGDGISGPPVASLLQDVNAMISEQLSECGSWNHLPPASAHDTLIQDERWAFLDKVFASVWFTRVWVIQEVGMASDPRVLFGDSEFDWTSLMRLQQWRLDYANFLIHPGSIPVHGLHTGTVHGWGVSKSPLQMKQDFGTFSKEWSFVKLLNNAKGLNATDSRDFIFSLLGHPSAMLASGRAIVEPDYEQDVLEVFNDFALAWLQETQDLSILCAVEHENGLLVDDLPSWVPRWGVSVVTQTLGLQTMLPFDASKGLEKAQATTTGRSHLEIRGVIFDTVRHVSTDLTRTALQLPKSSQSPNEVVAFWQYAKTQEAHEAYTAPTTPIMAFLYTLTGERYTGSHAQFKADRYAYALRLLELSGDPRMDAITAVPEHGERGNALTFVDHAWFFCNRRVLVYTEKGRCGFAPIGTRDGDVCVVVPGCKVPLILRPTKTMGRFRLVGEAFVRGAMEGEIVVLVEENGLVIENIVLE
jgi:hypothetical protein